ncbi:hypothetical protein NSK_002198 [Nannochloropsis salina CCMP1776]|uniref:SnoaL-like domain-containing protein n=1 Tax=Nannochloropsis salina CCMP1776 TaxID=1027361 RepID=A0A4D9D469_9STRA|nr:hypothetical protein NSK_002198 [Nannochloropsis salina CCMP1776]|eukprot:TFJ86541.1 hypothetical protein NSK_002198 [Nannochloropsis salina CCMP1776]
MMRRILFSVVGQSVLLLGCFQIPCAAWAYVNPGGGLDSWSPSSSLSSMTGSLRGGSGRAFSAGLRMAMSNDGGLPLGEEPEGTRVEEALRVTTRQIKALQRLVDSFQDVPPADQPPVFPPAEVRLPVATRESVEGDKAQVLELNAKYYDDLNGRDVKSILSLWKEDGAVQMYANEDRVIRGLEEIDKHMDSRFKNPWATNKHKERMDVTKEDERVFLRGINALVTNKEMWVNPISKEKLIMFSTKIWQKSNGEWRLVHVHSGDGSQVEVHPNGQMKLSEGSRGVGQQQLFPSSSSGGAGGRQEAGQSQLGSVLGGLLGGGSGGLGGIVPGESGFTADGREYRTIMTPEGYRIIVGSGQAQGGLLGAGSGQGRSGQETKEALLKALIQDLSKNGKQEVIPLQLGARGGRGGGGGELFSGSLDGGRGRRGGGDGANDGLEDLGRKTVDAVRQLCHEGRLTVTQKQKLIFSVIRSTKQEEVSQVEMAYDLLVENALAGEDSALEEFADQCVLLCAAGGAASSLVYDETGQEEGEDGVDE